MTSNLAPNSAQRKILPDDLDRNSLDPSAMQARASNPATSVWVNASAGSGKTTVLTSRVIRLLLAGVAPQRILCLTFTRAAAAEMVLRVTDRLGRWAICDDAVLQQELADLSGEKHTPPPKEQMLAARRLFAQVLACPGGLRIRTIHAFCQEILGRFPVEAGLPPHFSVVDEGDAAEMEDDALTDLLRRVTTKADDAHASTLRHLVLTLGESSLTKALRTLLGARVRLLAARDKAGGTENLVAKIRSALELAPDENEASITNEAIAGIRDDAMRDLGLAMITGGVKAKKRGQDLLDWLSAPIETRNTRFVQYWRCFLTAKQDYFEDYGDKKLLNAHPEIDDVSRREAASLLDILGRLEAAEIAEGTASVLRFGLQLAETYEAKKKARAALDFTDLVSRTNALLSREGIAPWVLYKLDGGLDHILVDEAQDTSREQWDIVATLADEFFAGKSAKDDVLRTLFVVGDEKQSIFSFQNADPEAFADMRAQFRGRILAAGRHYHEEPMNLSFRSAPQILNAVDATFAPDIVRAGVSATAVAHRAAKRRGGGERIGHVEVWPLLPQPIKQKDEQTWVLPLEVEEGDDPESTLAAHIANQIHGWLTTRRILPGESKPITPGDIMILLRRRGRFADYLVRALKKRDVPVMGVDRMHLLQQLPVMDLLALMQFVLLPEDNLTLATVLRTPLLNVSEDDLMALAAQRGQMSLWQALIAKREAHPAVHAYLAHILGRADYTTPFAFLAEILQLPCPGSTTSGRHALWQRLGPDALDPIQELLGATQDFGHGHAPSLQNFLHWLMMANTVIKREMDKGNSATGGQVRIMTVHASKGLEAPIVFLPDTGGVPRTTSVPSLQWFGELNDIPLYLPRRPKFGVAAETWGTARVKQMQEYRRLLYVAMTRPANELYVAGVEPAKNAGGQNESWHFHIASALKDKHQEHALDPASPAGSIALADAYLPPAVPITAAAPAPITPVPLPKWSRTSVPPEESAARTIAPSHIGDDAESEHTLGVATPDAAFHRGRVIHRLLQSLPDVAPEGRAAAAKRFLASPRHHLLPDAQADMAAEVLRLMENPNYAPLWGANSRAEAPLVGMVNGPQGSMRIAGQVDRLCLVGDEVWVVDYKTNRPPPDHVEDVAPAYIAQMAAYDALLAILYPTKKRRSFLLWTYKTRLMELPPDLLKKGTLEKDRKSPT